MKKATVPAKTVPQKSWHSLAVEDTLKQLDTKMESGSVKPDSQRAIGKGRS